MTTFPATRNTGGRQGWGRKGEDVVSMCLLDAPGRGVQEQMLVGNSRKGGLTGFVCLDFSSLPFYTECDVATMVCFKTNRN